MRQGAVRLANGQTDLVTTTIAPGNSNRFPVTGIESVTDNRLARLIAGIMKLLPDAWDCHQPACDFIFTSEMPDLPIKLSCSQQTCSWIDRSA